MQDWIKRKQTEHGSDALVTNNATRLGGKLRLASTDDKSYEMSDEKNKETNKLFKRLRCSWRRISIQKKKSNSYIGSRNENFLTQIHFYGYPFTTSSNLASMMTHLVTVVFSILLQYLFFLLWVTQFHFNLITTML